MKTLSLFSTCLLSSVLLATACTPKDVPVTDSNTRNKILEQKAKKAAGGKGQNGQDRPIKVGGYQGAALLMEKQIEAIELVRLALGADDGTKAGVKVTTEKESTEEKQVALSLGFPELLYKTDKGEFKTTLSKNLEGSVKPGSGVDTWSLSINNKDKQAIKQTVDNQAKKGVYLNYFENKFSLTADATSADQKSVTIVLQAEGNMNGKAAGVVYKESFSFKVTTTVDKASLLSDEVKILSMSGELTTQNADKSMESRPNTTTIQGQSQVLKAQGKCNELVGTAKITSDKSGKPTAISFEADRIFIGTTFYKTTVPDCGMRPTVDLSLLLPF